MKRSMGTGTGTAPRVAVVSSSPGRAEKLPAPPGLARLLRGKSGSRSRGRSSVARSSPMFGARSRAGPSSEDGEPSSPKVTCIGQVRIRGKNGKPKPAPGSKKPKLEYPHRTTWPTVRCCCCCLERPLLFKKFLKPPAGGPHRWWSLGRRRESIGREESEPSYPPPVAAAAATATARVSVSDLGDQEDDVADGEEETRVFMSSTPTPSPTPPPKNALLLMRCRSEPHRSAFTRFAVSPPAAGEKEREEPADDRNSCKVIGGTVVLKRSKSVPARMLLTPEITKTATHHLASPPPTKDYTMRPWLSSIIF